MNDLNRCPFGATLVRDGYAGTILGSGQVQAAAIWPRLAPSLVVDRRDATPSRGDFAIIPTRSVAA